MKGIIFDFDGVIADTEPEKFRIVKNILERYNYQLNEEDFFDFIGKRTVFFLKEKFPLMPQEVINSIRTQKENVPPLSLKKINLIPGILELLKFLKLNRYKVAISSGSELDFIKKILELNKLRQYFDSIVSKEDFTFSKPNPECYKIALRKLNLNPKEVIIVEDSVAGIKAGIKAGCTVFAVDIYLKRELCLDANKQFNNHFEILEYFKNNKF